MPPRPSTSRRRLIRIAALPGRVMVAKRGLVSIRSMPKVTGESGWNDNSRSPSTISTSRRTSVISIAVNGLPSRRLDVPPRLPPSRRSKVA